MDQLRRIAVFVDAPDPGLFFWVLIENTDDAEIWRDIEAADEPETTWRAAFDVGNAALLALVSDQAAGPVCGHG